MRQQHPPAGTVFLLCLGCDRAEWRRIDAEHLQLNTENLAPCRHCGGPTEQRFPHTLALTAEEKSILNTVAAWGHRKTHDAVMIALHKQFRHLATERAGKGKPLPQWAADWLQNNPEK